MKNPYPIKSKYTNKKRKENCADYKPQITSQSLEAKVANGSLDNLDGKHCSSLLHLSDKEVTTGRVTKNIITASGRTVSAESVLVNKVCMSGRSSLCVFALTCAYV